MDMVAIIKITYLVHCVFIVLIRINKMYMQTCIVMMYIQNVSNFKGILFLLNSTPAHRLLFTVYTVLKMAH